MKRIDFADAAMVRAWLADLRARVGDVDAVVRDMLAPPWQRELGPVLHAATYKDARTSILDALASAEPAPDPDATPVPSGDDDRPPWEVP
jgi:hypothetical protein